MTAQEAREMISAGSICPNCGGVHIRVLVYATQDCVNGVWKEPRIGRVPRILRAWCWDCGNGIYQEGEE